MSNSPRPVTADPKVLDVTALRYLVAVADCGSMTAASKHLRLSQPSITNAIQRLEEQLGVKLFHRERSGIQLTAEGQHLYERALHVLDFMCETERLLHTFVSDEVGHFRIGCHVSLGAYFLPDFLRTFYQATPHIEIDLWNATSAEVTAAVVARQIEFGLVVNPLPHPDLVVVELFGDAVDLFVLVPPDAPPPPRCATEDSGVADAILRERPLVYAGRVGQSHSIIDMLAASGRAPRRRLACGDLEMVKSLTLGGVGAGLLPRRVALYGQPGRLRRLHRDLPYFPDTICLLYRSDMHRTKAALRLKTALVDHGRSLGTADDAYDADRVSAATGA